MWPKGIQNYTTNGSKTESILLEMSKGEAYQNFATSIRAYQTLKTYRYRLVHYVSRVRDTLDLDKIVAADLDKPRLTSSDS